MAQNYIIQTETANIQLNNTMTERFLIWVNRNYSNTMNTRLRNPNFY